MTDYKLKCEQPTIKCRFVYAKHQEFQLYIELTLPEIDQVKKGGYDIMDLWVKKNPDADKYDEMFVDADSVSKVQVENKNSAMSSKDKWLTIK